jgi:hypothetical protein
MLRSHELARLLLEQPDMPVVVTEYDDFSDDCKNVSGIEVKEDVALSPEGKLVDMYFGLAHTWCRGEFVKGRVVRLR